MSIVFTRAKGCFSLILISDLVIIIYYNRREQWHLFSSYASWQHLVAQTKRQSKDHAALSDIYANTVIQRLNQVTDEVQRIYRRVNITPILLIPTGGNRKEKKV